MGHPKVAVLDGGLKKWKYEGHPIESDGEEICDSDFDYKINPDRIWNSKKIKNYETVANQVQMIDTRLPSQFRNGTIKGAKNFPASNLINLETK